jgi:hypothetical protein
MKRASEYVLKSPKKIVDYVRNSPEKATGLVFTGVGLHVANKSANEQKRNNDLMEERDSFEKEKHKDDIFWKEKEYKLKKEEFEYNKQQNNQKTTVDQQSNNQITLFDEQPSQTNDDKPLGGETTNQDIIEGDM